MSLNAIFRYPDLYRTVMAIASISDQRLYDTMACFRNDASRVTR